MTHHVLYPCLFLGLATAAAAQLPFVSPTQTSGTEGSANNVFPFQNATTQTYQQVHGDLPATSLTITHLSFRIDETATPTTYAGTRVLDLELQMGNGPASYADVARRFAANFTGTPTVVVARRALNWGPYGTTAGGSGPEPFTGAMDVPLDVPFAWAPTPTPTLTWQAVIYGNPFTGPNPVMDAVAAPVVAAAEEVTGAGCTCSGANFAQTLAVSAADVQGHFVLGVGVNSGPSLAPVVLAIGLRDPGLTLRGLCSPLHTDLQVVLSLGTTSAAGAIDVAHSQVGLAMPNTFAGAQLFLQAHALDAGFGVPVCNSQGRAITVRAATTGQELKVARMYDTPGSVGGTEGLWLTRGMLGYGLVTQFR